MRGASWWRLAIQLAVAGQSCLFCSGRCFNFGLIDGGDQEAASDNTNGHSLGHFSNVGANGGTFVGRLARNLGIVDLYSNFYRGVRTKLVEPIFGSGSSNRFRRPDSGDDEDDDGVEQNSVDYVFTGGGGGGEDDYDYRPELAPLELVTEVPTSTVPPLPAATMTTTEPPSTTMPHGIYAATPLSYVTSPYFVKSLPSYLPPATTTPTPPPLLRQFFSSRPPHIISNYSHVDTQQSQLEKVVPVYGVPEKTAARTSDFYFTTPKSEEESLTELFREAVTTSYKDYYLPPTPKPEKVRSGSLAEKWRNHRVRKYEFTTLPGLFVSSIPPPRYHRVNPDLVSRSEAVYKDPLYKLRRAAKAAAEKLRANKKRRKQASQATLQPRHSPSTTEQPSQSVGPLVVSHGMPKARPEDIRYPPARTLVPLSLLKVYPVYVAGGGGADADSYQTLGSEPQMVAVMSPPSQQVAYEEEYEYEYEDGGGESEVPSLAWTTKQPPAEDEVDQERVVSVFAGDGSPVLRLTVGEGVAPGADGGGDGGLIAVTGADAADIPDSAFPFRVRLHNDTEAAADGGDGTPLLRLVYSHSVGSPFEVSDGGRDEEEVTGVEDANADIVLAEEETTETNVTMTLEQKIAMLSEEIRAVNRMMMAAMMASTTTPAASDAATKQEFKDEK